MITAINPTNGRELGRYELHDDAYVDAALSAAAAAQKTWRKVPVEQRIGLLRGMAKVLRANKARYAQMITFEMGKPIVEAEGEIEKCAYNCDFYTEHAPQYLADEPVKSNASQSVVAFDPLGVVLAIMPWNYPFWQFFRFAAPAFAAGNGAILKHANNVPQCALAIEEVMREAGCPEGLFRTLLIEPQKVARLIEDDRIAAVTLTGSTEVGAVVAAQAGKALKKQVLELGGSDPFIVLADADLEEAAATAVKARANLMNGLHAQVEKTVAAGATLKMGGKPVDGDGFYYPPTVLDHVTPEMTAFREETFGPVAAIVRVKDAEEAIRLANQTEFGLGSAIWSKNVTRARALARELDAGAVFINGMVASDPRYPFGGIKRSGYGRELGVYGIREFVNIKTVWIGPANAAK